MKRKLIIDNTVINDESPCFVIAEIGHNHMGDLNIAKKMFLKAKECGANAVKLQKRDNKALFTKELYNSPYNNELSYGATYGEHRQALEFGIGEYTELKSYAKEIGITFFATAFDFKSVDFLAKLDMPAYKIASADLTNTPLLKYAARVGKPMIVSTGGGSINDVQRAYDTIMSINTNLSILQCTASYPAEPKDMNLKVISTYKERFSNIIIGLSDHQSGIAMALVGFCIGARVIEKHFTLNRSMRGTDHGFSLEPIGLKKMIRDLERARVALGDGKKEPLYCEEKSLLKMGKKLVAGRNLQMGHILKNEDIAIKSPGDGLPPYEIDKIIGMETLCDLKEDDSITFDILRKK